MARVKIDMPDRYAFSMQIPVRIQDVNYGGHVGNDAILSMIHDARVQFLKSLGASELDAFGAGLIMADVAIVYKNESFHGDILQFEVCASEFSAFGFDLFYKVSTRREGKDLLIAEAKTGMVCFDYTQRKITKVPAALKAAMEIKES
ncbi:thioesterase [Chitinophaga caeni]|uniref:Thioesterase n=1 Tax=Chitinophaga caeni TaxID=2029983 RepID=A0A291QU49_9BACT|nr:thioesterase family protein [Chitinophaga caeni]ATL47412.1 thioesterase [Chitinophaga caeni]